jgi:hypothetical protein
LAIYDVITSYFEENLSFDSIELGSHAGKSSMMIAKALNDIRVLGSFYLVDPLFGIDEADWGQTCFKIKEDIPWNYAKKESFKKEVFQRVYKQVEWSIAPVMIGLTSYQFLPSFRGQVGVLFIDSDVHTREQCLAEELLSRQYMSQDSIVLFHDHGNYEGPVQACEELVSQGLYEYIPIDWEGIKSFVKENDLEKDNNSWHQTHEEMPCYLAALRRV